MNVHRSGLLFGCIEVGNTVHVCTNGVTILYVCRSGSLFVCRSGMCLSPDGFP